MSVSGVLDEGDDDEGPELAEADQDSQAEAWQMNALLGLLAHINGGKIQLDLKRLREIVGRPLAIHFDPGSDLAILELLPLEPKSATAIAPTTRQ